MALDLDKCLRTALRDKQTAPAWAVTALLPSTRLLMKRREVMEMERVLQNQREEFQQRMERLQQRQQQLGQREEQLQDVILKFDAFLKVSAARRELALRRADEERAWVAGRDAEAARLRQELEGLRGHREHLAQHLWSLRRFGDYLRGVLARTGQFQDVPAMLARFGALAGARAALVQQVEAGQERLAQGWAQLRRYQEEAGSELLRTNDELAQLRAQLEATRHDVLQGLATAWLKVPTDVALEDTEAQLDTVLFCMQDLAAICTELRPTEPGPCPPRLPAATSTRPPHRGGARPPPSQE
ncbi:cilia- and flagella-associated protein 73 isoform 3-T3 [Chlamydotis macqueenii]